MPRPLRSRPLTVILDTTERCNLKCKMCHFSATDRLLFPPHDRTLSDNGILPVEVFEKIAAELFPRSWRVALACAAEPMIHPMFERIVEITGRYDVPDVWFPTNLLALTESKAEAICRAGVRSVGVSIDGTHAETYEHIRVGGRFARLEKCLELFNRVRAGSRTRLRIIFTWMRSNRHDLETLPAFAQRWGASEIDVRFVTPTPGVDTSSELLDGDDPAQLRSELRSVAEEAVRRGLQLSSFPDYELPEERPRGPLGRARRAWFRWRAGLDRMEYTTYRWQERVKGCVWPSDFYVVRPNGAVSPCIFWAAEPIGFFPETDYRALSDGEPLRRIREGLRTGQPVETCVSCSQRKDAFYYRLRRLKSGGSGTEPAETDHELVQLGK